MKKKYVKLLVIWFVIFFIASCSKSEAVGGNSNLASVADSVSEVVLRINKDVFDTINSNRLNNKSEGNSFTIKNSKREGDFIQIELSYSGGCKKHTFEIIWDGLVYTDDPCHINLLLVHRGNNDNCEAFITETIFVNLKELIGEVTYKDECAYNIFSTYNSGETPDVVITGL